MITYHSVVEILCKESVGNTEDRKTDYLKLCTFTLLHVFLALPCDGTLGSQFEDEVLSAGQTAQWQLSTVDLQRVPEPHPPLHLPLRDGCLPIMVLFCHFLCSTSDLSLDPREWSDVANSPCYNPTKQCQWTAALSVGGPFWMTFPRWDPREWVKSRQNISCTRQFLRFILAPKVFFLKKWSLLK